MNEQPPRSANMNSDPLPPADHGFFDPTAHRLDAEHRRKAIVDLALAVGPRYARCRLSGFEIYEPNTAEDRPSQHQALVAIGQFVAEMPSRIRSGGGLVLFGRPGTGKDHLASAAMFAAIETHGFSVAWASGAELFAELRDAIRTATGTGRTFDRLVEPQILVVSDPIPPRDDASAFATDFLLRVLDRRYRWLKSTWATMNATNGAEAEARLASPIVDRLRHGSLCIKCDWPSYRTRNRGGAQ